MSKEKETDAATVLSQMSQLVCVTSSFDFSSSQDSILDEDAIGATCTLQPSTLDSDILFSLPNHSSLVNAKKAQEDPYIGFDDSEHPYAANMVETSSAFPNLTPLPVSPSFKKPNLSRGKESLLCMVCSKQFKTHYSLMVHMRFHDGEKPYSCLLCTKSFTTKSDLTRHSKVHDNSDVRPFMCEVCQKSFRDPATFTRHKKIHDPKTLIQCQHCDKTFTRSDNHRNHMKTHLQDKPFKCHICKSEFAYRSSFKRHLSAHDPGSMFMCDVCGKTFRRSDYVERHKRLVHSEKATTVSNISQQDSSLGKLKVNNKRLRDKQAAFTKKKIRKKTNGSSKIGNNCDNETEEDDNINAVPILMSMAEQAAKPKKMSSFIGDTSNLLVTNDLMSQVTSLPSSPSNIGDDLINYINDDSSEDDETIYTDEDENDEYEVDEADDDFDELDRFSDKLEMFSDEFQS